LRTTLTQNGAEILLESDCRNYLKGLNGAINGRMSIVFSNWVNTSTYAEQFELEFGQESQGCDTASNTIANFTVTEGGSVEDFPPVWVEGDAAPSLSACDTTPDCTECRNSYWSNAPDVLYPTCVDY